MLCDFLNLSVFSNFSNFWSIFPTPRFINRWYLSQKNILEIIFLVLDSEPLSVLILWVMTPIHTQIHSFIQIHNISKNISTSKHSKAPWSHPKMQTHLINNIQLKESWVTRWLNVHLCPSCHDQRKYGSTWSNNGFTFHSWFYPKAWGQWLSMYFQRPPNSCQWQRPCVTFLKNNHEKEGEF